MAYAHPPKKSDQPRSKNFIIYAGICRRKDKIPDVFQGHDCSLIATFEGRSAGLSGSQYVPTKLNSKTIERRTKIETTGLSSLEKLCCCFIVVVRGKDMEYSMYKTYKRGSCIQLDKILKADHSCPMWFSARCLFGDVIGLGGFPVWELLHHRQGISPNSSLNIRSTLHY